ncbi:DUF1661 domain-containing protein [Porphyromonas gingivalis]|uniref:DUF1661 domain-containing protein n=1 Tax=Porphyromonas gingivalis TaxID=837 RepID=UPI002A020B27|nr:DUF1661 domain-containing protein [Porphyromonas gingivalis]MCE8180601.1 DUF1661 domain-containing protein [Porphyromonas gingivalis]
MARKIFASRTKTKKFSRHLFSVHVTAEKNFPGRNDHFFLWPAVFCAFGITQTMIFLLLIGYILILGSTGDFPYFDSL